jgi:hypothetical protein
MTRKDADLVEKAVEGRTIRRLCIRPCRSNADAPTSSDEGENAPTSLAEAQLSSNASGQKQLKRFAA